jgi:protein dithiol oxidoreductase (disulfide-forming)
MDTRKLWILASFLIAGCGGSNEQSADVAAEGEQPAVAETGAAPEAAGTIAEPELVATSDNGTSPTSERFRMGVNYMRLSPTQPTSSGPDQVEVAEIFWYGCPHCFNFDPTIERWRAGIASYVSFVRVPAVWNPLLQLHARAFYTAEALGKGAEMHSEFFREIHERGNTLETEAKLQDFFGRFGVDAAAFKAAFDSFAVHTKLQRADELSRRYRIGSVPTIVVNGKYTTDGSQAGSYEALMELVDELTVAEHDGR